MYKCILSEQGDSAEKNSLRKKSRKDSEENLIFVVLESVIIIIRITDISQRVLIV